MGLESQLLDSLPEVSCRALSARAHQQADTCRASLYCAAQFCWHVEFALVRTV